MASDSDPVPPTTHPMGGSPASEIPIPQHPLPQSAVEPEPQIYAPCLNDLFNIQNTVFELFIDRNETSVGAVMNRMKKHTYTFNGPIPLTIIYSARVKKYYAVTPSKPLSEMFSFLTSLFVFHQYHNWVPSKTHNGITYYNPFYNTNSTTIQERLNYMFPNYRTEAHMSRNYCLLSSPQPQPPTPSSTEYMFVERHKRTDYYIFIPKEPLHNIIKYWL